MQKKNREAKTVEALRERERESYTLVTESAVLFNSLTHTHTSNLIKNINNIDKKLYIVCVYNKQKYMAYFA